MSRSLSFVLLFTSLALATACGADNSASDNCGDGFADPGEQCDDGNLVPGDGCSPTCQVENPADCGNGAVEAGETCDDGNTDPGDGCSASCQLEGSADCGDGVRGATEECDDGNTTSGDGCSSSCKLEGSGPFCGDGVVESGEQCDDSNSTSGDGCSSSCQLEPGACGNGTLNSGEQCDDGNTNSGDGCSASCQLEGPVCGNGTTEAGEDCDDGNTINFDGCSSACNVEECGDGIVQPNEQCDDGNTTSGDGCDDKCDAEAAAACGNGVLNQGEGCDDGNTNPGDGCDASCGIEPLGECTPDFELSCGMVDTWSTTFQGSTNDVSSYQCVSWNESGREYGYTFLAPTTGNITLNLSGTSADLDLFVIPANGSPQQQQQQAPLGSCDPDSCLGFGDNQVTFAATAGQLYYVVVDGYLGAEGQYSLSVTCGACGDGNVGPGEQCDDGNTAGGDGCSAGCQLEGCGNGVMDIGEACDDGNTNPGDGCSADCTIEECGNNVVDAGEECDDGNTNPGDGCDQQCLTEGGECTAAFSLGCNSSDSWNTTSFGSGDDVDGYSCVSWTETGREYAYQFTAPTTGDVTVELSDLGSVDLDVFVMGQTCAGTSCLAYGNNSTTFSAQAGQTYYIAVDGFLGAEGSYTIDLSCGGGYCGDGTQAAGEECDDGNNTDGDGCSADCSIEAPECTPDVQVSCNVFDSWSTNALGSTDDVDGYGCVSWNETGREYAYQFTATTDATMTVNLTPETGVDLDVFVVADSGSPAQQQQQTGGLGGCEPGNCTGYGNTTTTFDALAGETYYIVVDGYNGAAGDYTVEFLCN